MTVFFKGIALSEDPLLQISRWAASLVNLSLGVGEGWGEVREAGVRWEGIAAK